MNNEQPTTNKKYVSPVCWMEEDEDVAASQSLAANGEVIAICCLVGDEALATFAAQHEVTTVTCAMGQLPIHMMENLPECKLG